MKLQSTSRFLHMEPIYIVFVSAVSFQKLFKILQIGALVTIALLHFFFFFFFARTFEFWEIVVIY